MASFCALSGELTEDPVVITTTGYTFDGKLLDKHCEVHGNVCPVSGKAFEPNENILKIKVRNTHRQSHFIS